MDEMDRDFWNNAYQEDSGHTVVEGFFLRDGVDGLNLGTELDLWREAVRVENVFPLCDDPRREAGPAANVAFVRPRKP
jgi:hypothetical protein